MSVIDKSVIVSSFARFTRCLITQCSHIESWKFLLSAMDLLRFVAAAEVGRTQNFVADLGRNAIEQRHVRCFCSLNVPVASISRAKALQAGITATTWVCQPEWKPPA